MGKSPSRKPRNPEISSVELIGNHIEGFPVTSWKNEVTLVAHLGNYNFQGFASAQKPG